jgi:hypothetical protein
MIACIGLTAHTRMHGGGPGPGSKVPLLDGHSLAWSAAIFRPKISRNLCVVHFQYTMKLATYFPTTYYVALTCLLTCLFSAHYFHFALTGASEELQLLA